MTDKSVNRVIPDEFYKASNFFTLSGAAGAVWLFCLVLANLDTDTKFLIPSYYRLIAIVLSEIIALTMLLRSRRKKKLEHWLFAFFNGLLVFINASGLNAISSKLSFENVKSIKNKAITGDLSFNEQQYATFGLDFFKPEISWWLEDSYYENKKIILQENASLIEEQKKSVLIIDSLKQRHEVSKKINDSLKRYSTTDYSLSKKNNFKVSSTNDCSSELIKLNVKINKLRSLNNSITKGLTGEIKVLKGDLSRYKKMEHLRMVKMGEGSLNSSLMGELDRLRGELIDCESKSEQH